MRNRHRNAAHRTLSIHHLDQLQVEQHAVERGPQLVGHVREELRLVLRGQRELGGLVLERHLGLLDLVVLLLDLRLLVGQQACLFLELRVGLLQLFLAALQLTGEGLRLLEQLLRPHVGLDGVDHDADRLGELVEERLVRRVELLERRELHDAAHLALEHHRHHQHVERRGL